MLFGIGPKIFREKCLDKKYHTLTPIDGSINGCQSHPHNTYIQILLETGLVGITIISIIFIFINVFFFIFFINNYRKILNKFFLLNLFCLINIYINFWPLMPSGNFFHNWLSIIYFLPIGFFIYSWYYKNQPPVK